MTTLRFNSRAWLQLFGFVLETRGVEHSIYGRLYRDETVEIRLFGQAGGVEVERRENRNPVTIYDRNGSCIRSHGEFTFVKNHLLNLVASILEEGK